MYLIVTYAEMAIDHKQLDTIANERVDSSFAGKSRLLLRSIGNVYVVSTNYGAYM